MIYKLTHPERAGVLFAQAQGTMILSCLQNVMGEIYADNLESPKSVAAVLGIFCFFAGEVNAELIAYRPDTYTIPFIPMSADAPSLRAAIQTQYGERAKKVARYAIKKEAGILSERRLQQIVDTLGAEYELNLIDEVILNWSRRQNWCREQTSLYEDYEAYRTTGLGIVILKDELPVSGTSSYSSYRGGIEIQVDTEKEYRRQKLAEAVCVKLMLEYLKRGWYPNWGTHNMASVHLAEGLDYHFDREYTVFEIHGYQKGAVTNKSRSRHKKYTQFYREEGVFFGIIYV